MDRPTIPISPSVKKPVTNNVDILPISVLQKLDNIIKIAPIKTFNDWVVLIPFNLDTNITLPSGTDYRNIGIVVGKSDTIMSSNGNYISSRLDYGMVVLFQKRAVVGDMVINVEPYIDRRLIILSERNIFLQLPSVPHEILDYEIGCEDFPDLQPGDD